MSKCLSIVLWQVKTEIERAMVPNPLQNDSVTSDLPWLLEAAAGIGAQGLNPASGIITPKHLCHLLHNASRQIAVVLLSVHREYVLYYSCHFPQTGMDLQSLFQLS